MPRASFVYCRAAQAAAAFVLASALVLAPAVAADTPVEIAERDLRIAAESAADRIQRQVSASINVVMARRPATTFNIRNEIRRATNAIRAAATVAGGAFAARLETSLDTLDDSGGTVVDVSRVRDSLGRDIPADLSALVAEGIRDVASLQRNGNRVTSVRGTLVGRYELFVSKPEDARARVRLGVVALGESQLIRGAISTSAASEFFLAPLAGPTPALTELPASIQIRAVRWLYRGGAFVVSTREARTDRFVSVEPDAFSISGVDLLPARTRIEIERRLAGSADIRSNPDGADGFFRSVTYTFQRIIEGPVVVP